MQTVNIGNRKQSEVAKENAASIERSQFWIRQDKTECAAIEHTRIVARGCWQGSTGPENGCNDCDC